MKKFELKNLILISFMCSVLVSNAQFNTDFFPDTIQKVMIGIEGNYNYGSSVMNSSFMNKFLYGGTITREDKDAAYKNLGSNNRLGYDINYQLTAEIPYDSLFNRNNLSLIIGLKNTEHFDAAFESNLFKLAFDGNKQFAGQKINIGNTNFNSFTYQSLALGLVNYKKSFNKNTKEGFIINLIKGQKHEAITLPEGYLFTEKNGRQIDVDLNYMYNTSDTSNTGLKAFNGLGVSTTLFTSFYLKNGDKVNLRVEDLGFITWSKQSLEMNTDNSYSFDGVDVKSIFDLNDTVLNVISKDSIINSVVSTEQKKTYSTALPTSFNIIYTKQFNSKTKINAGVYHKFLANYFPLIFTNFYYKFHPTFSTKVHLSYGGYGELNVGLAFAKSIKKSISIFVGTNNIEGFIFPDIAYTNNGFVGIKTYF